MPVRKTRFLAPIIELAGNRAFSGPAGNLLKPAILRAAVRTFEGNTMARSPEESLRATLGRVAPGTPLRDGLERILRGRTVREGLSRMAEASLLDRFL